MEKTGFNKLLEQRGFPQSLSGIQHWRVLFWAIFRKRKVYNMINQIKAGKHALLAYNNAKNNIQIQKHGKTNNSKSN